MDCRCDREASSKTIYGLLPSLKASLVAIQVPWVDVAIHESLFGNIMPILSRRLLLIRIQGIHIRSQALRI